MIYTTSIYKIYSNSYIVLRVPTCTCIKLLMHVCKRASNYHTGVDCCAAFVCPHRYILLRAPYVYILHILCIFILILCVIKPELIAVLHVRAPKYTFTILRAPTHIYITLFTYVYIHVFYYYIYTRMFCVPPHIYILHYLRMFIYMCSIIIFTHVCNIIMCCAAFAVPG